MRPPDQNEFDTPGRQRVFGPVSFVRVCVCVVFVLFYISYILIIVFLYVLQEYCCSGITLFVYCFCIVFCVKCEGVWNYIRVASSTSLSNHALV